MKNSFSYSFKNISRDFFRASEFSKRISKKDFFKRFSYTFKEVHPKMYIKLQILREFFQRFLQEFRLGCLRDAEFPTNFCCSIKNISRDSCRDSCRNCFTHSSRNFLEYFLADILEEFWWISKSNSSSYSRRNI